jgi:Tfp pilus assembly protein PilP
VSIKREELHIKEVSFRRKFNLGNFETEDIEFVATVSEGQNPSEVLQALDKATVAYRKHQMEK